MGHRSRSDSSDDEPFTPPEAAWPTERHPSWARAVIRGAVVAGVLALGVTRRASATPPAEPSGTRPLEVVVRGEKAPPPPKEPSMAGSVIREDRLRAPGLSAGDVLRTQPGVAVANTGGYGALSTASIRGATAAQTPVYLGGVRLNDDVGGTADLSLVPLWMLDRVEIYRSGAPLEADQLGIGGAIFFEPRFPRKPEAAVGATAGSFGERAISAMSGLATSAPRCSSAVATRAHGTTTNSSTIAGPASIRRTTARSHARTPTHGRRTSGGSAARTSVSTARSACSRTMSSARRVSPG